MLFKLGLKNMKHNLVMNVLIILQMTVVFVIAVSMISTIVSRFRFYTPIEEFLESKGCFYSINNAVDPEKNETLRTSERLGELIEGESEVTASYNTWLSLSPDEKNINTVSYDDKFIELFAPDLESGNWFDLNKAPDDEIVQTVVSENQNGFKVGDIVTLYCFEDQTKAEIVGVLKSNSKIVGFSKSGGKKYNCSNAFSTYSLETEEKPLFIFRHKELLDKKVTMQVDGTVFITYPDDTPDEVMKKNSEVMNQMHTSVMVPLDEMKSNSFEYIFSQIDTLLPIFICVLVLTLVGG